MSDSIVTFPSPSAALPHDQAAAVLVDGELVGVCPSSLVHAWHGYRLDGKCYLALDGGPLVWEVSEEIMVRHLDPNEPNRV